MTVDFHLCFLAFRNPSLDLNLPERSEGNALVSSKSLVVVGESIIVSLSLTAMDSDSDSLEEEPTTEVSGLWIDPVAKVKGA